MDYCVIYTFLTDDRPAAHSTRKTKHKTPQLLCSSSTVFARRRAKSAFSFACGGQRGPTWSSPTPQIPGTWQLFLVYGPPRPQNPVPWFAADGAIRRIRRGWEAQLQTRDRANQGGWRSNTLGRQNDQETHKEWGRPTSQIGLEGLLELNQRSLARTVL